MSIAQAILQEFEHEADTTRRFLQRLPEDKLTWRPHAKSMTAGQLALHIAQVPAGVLRMSLNDEAAAPDMSQRQQPANLKQILDELERAVAYVRQTLPGIDDQRMLGTFKIVKAGQTLFSLPRVAFLRNIMLNHWYQHRGQFAVYLRLMGCAVPASYGPSADEEVMR